MADDSEYEPLKLTEAATYLIDECRMVLPGIQGLFGFQMVAVFSNGFSEKLSSSEQTLHVVAIISVVLAIALIMTPAAIHRRAERKMVSDKFLRVSSYMLLAAMFLLGAGIIMDTYLVTVAISHDKRIASITAVALLAIFFALWELLPGKFHPRNAK